jgi:hypothetical protein
VEGISQEERNASDAIDDNMEYQGEEQEEEEQEDEEMQEEDVCAARIAEGKKEDSYAALDKTSHEFLPLAFDVFCGTAPRADEFLRRLASISS